MDAKPIPQHFAYAPPAPAPIGGPKGPAGSQPVFATPIWVTAVRGFQLFLAFIIMILAGLLIHGLALDAIVFALVCVSTYYCCLLDTREIGRAAADG